TRWLAMRLEPDERSDQAPARIEPDPHLASAFTDERGGLRRRHDLHDAIEPRTVGRWGACAPHRPPTSDARDDHRHVFARWHDRFPRLLLLSEPVVERSHDEDHHEYGPDNWDLVQEVDVEIQQLLALRVVVRLDGLRVREDPQV